MIDMMMSVQDSTDVSSPACNLTHHACRHFWEGHGINNNSAVPFDNKRCVRDTHFSLSMHYRHDPVRDLTQLLPRPGDHALLSFSSDSASSTSWMTSLSVAQRRTSASGR